MAVPIFSQKLKCSFVSSTGIDWGPRKNDFVQNDFLKKKFLSKFRSAQGFYQKKKSFFILNQKIDLADGVINAPYETAHSNLHILYVLHITNIMKIQTQFEHGQIDIPNMLP